ncbi:MAG: DUF4249 domain-containing protein [Saprospiraceae bacterium]|nr:DUF4249 domain-containing protein [Saprospiraceae bacterium]
MKYPLYLSFVLLALLSSCEDPVDLGIPLVDPKLVIISNFSDLDTLEVVISKSQNAFEDGPTEYVSNAKVDIFQGNTYLETLKFVDINDAIFPSYYVSDFLVPEIGKTYTIEVSAPGFETVKAVNTIPGPATLDSTTLNLELDIVQQDLTFNQVNFTVSLKLKDPPGIENYYHLSFYQEGFDYKIDINGDTIREAFFSLPLAVEELGGDVPLVPYIDRRGVLLKDSDMTGSTLELLTFEGNFLFRRNDQLLGDFIIELRTVSEEYYLYHTSLARQYQSSLDPFSDPVILFNNIENGCGIFAGFISRFYLLDSGQ